MRNQELVLLSALAAVAASCGGGESSDDDPATRGAPSSLVRAPSIPSPRDCAAAQLRTSAPADPTLIARPGRYTYRTAGSVRSGDRNPRRLPRRTEYIITDDRRIGAVRCFRVQRRYMPRLADTATFAVRGGDVFLTETRVVAGGQLITIRPEPPVKSLDADDLEWSGSFRGPTRGRYAATVLGRRTFRIGGKRIRSVGVELRYTLDGEIRGSERSRRWFALDDRGVVSERVEQKRRFGLDPVVLDYRARMTGNRGGSR